MPTRRWLERALRDCANRADWVARSQEVAIPKKGGGTGMHREHKKFTFVLLMHRSLIRNTSSVGDHGRSPLLPMLRDGRSQQIAFAPDAPHQEITADRLCSRCSRISVLMEMREQIMSPSVRGSPLIALGLRSNDRARATATGTPPPGRHAGPSPHAHATTPGYYARTGGRAGSAQE